jgi:hypothetical protein
MYYVLQFDRSLPNPAMIPTRPEIAGFADGSFETGNRLPVHLPVFDFVIDEQGQGVLTDYLWTSLGTTFSARFRKALESAGVDNVDYYPVRVVNQVTGETRTDYFQANVVGSISCLDREASQIEENPYLPGLIQGINKMAVKEDNLHGELLFRLSEVSVILLAHERVKKAAEAAGLSGVVFPPAKGYSWP